MRAFRCRYRVSGAGPFPFDMLRYDNSYPASQSDAGKMEHHAREKREIEMESVRLVNTTPRPLFEEIACLERWHSFGWEVEHIDEPRRL